jgi:acetolactate synthase-1/3 small subunit
MKMIYMLSLTTDNALRVLQRISSIFSRKRLNVEQLTVVDIGHGNMSHFSIKVLSNEHEIQDLMNKLNKIVELHDVSVNCRVPVIPQTRTVNLEMRAN